MKKILFFDIPSSLVEPLPEHVSKIRQELQQQTDEILTTFVGSFAVYQGVIDPCV